MYPGVPHVRKTYWRASSSSLCQMPCYIKEAKIGKWTPGSAALDNIFYCPDAHLTPPFYSWTACLAYKARLPVTVELLSCVNFSVLIWQLYNFFTTTCESYVTDHVINLVCYALAEYSWLHCYFPKLSLWSYEVIKSFHWALLFFYCLHC